MNYSEWIEELESVCQRLQELTEMAPLVDIDDKVPDVVEKERVRASW